MKIRLLYPNKIEGRALSLLLNQKGYEITFPGLGEINFETTITNDVGLLVDTKLLFSLRKKKLLWLCNSPYPITLLGKVDHFFWFFRLNCRNVNFISKREDISELCLGINQMQNEHSFVSKNVLDIMKGDQKQIHSHLLNSNLSSHLTRTELKTMLAISLGKETKQIAQEWNRSHHTINNHRKNIIKKLFLKGTNSLLNFCFRNKSNIKTLVSINEYKEKIDRIIEYNQG